MPDLQEVSLVLVVVVVVLSFLCGLVLGRRCFGRLKLPLLIASALIVFRILLACVPGLEYRIFLGDWYSFIRFWWVFPPAMFVAGVGASQARGRLARGISVATAMMIFWFTARVTYASLVIDHGAAMDNFANRWTGNVTQSKVFSCGAAGAAMLLHFEGIHVSEGEMATICRTNSVTGTDEFAVRRGLRQKLSGTGKEVVIETLDFETLREMDVFPAMVVMDFGFMKEHWVVVYSIFGNGDVKVLDPMCGRPLYNPEQFQKRWKNVILYVK